MLKPEEDYSRKIERLYCKESGQTVINFTFQVTEQCNLRCTYCYQIDKKDRVMTFDTAKAAVDYILASAVSKDSIFSYERNKGIIFEFIGGEPFLCVDLISDIVDYIECRLLELDSPWVLFHRYSFSSNGTLYFTDKVQEFIRKYQNIISIGITVDGCKEIHDKCRVFPDGSGSYDLAIAAALDQKKKYNNLSTKITLSPDNISYFFIAIKNLLNLGYNRIHANCVFEEGWSSKHALILYDEMVKISDYILENDLEDNCFISLFNDSNYKPLGPDNTNNWCGGTGKMVAIDWRGLYYPCTRYMPTCLGDVKPIVIGDINTGIYNTCETCKIRDDFNCITRQSQSTKECLDCNIAAGCAWCSGYNYQMNGTPNARVTFICIMHKAAAIANYYYFKREAEKKERKCEFILNMDPIEIKAIIGEDRYNKL